MRRIASHYVYWHRFYRMHYLESDDRGAFVGVYPLDEEIGGTEFYDGILIPVVDSSPLLHCKAIQIPLVCHSDSTVMEAVSHRLAELQVSGGVEPGRPVQFLLLGGIPLTAAELGTNDGSCNGYIQRL